MLTVTPCVAPNKQKTLALQIHPTKIQSTHFLYSSVQVKLDQTSLGRLMQASTMQIILSYINCFEIELADCWHQQLTKGKWWLTPVYSQSSTVLSTHQQLHKERVYSQSSTVLSTHQQLHKERVYSQSSTVINTPTVTQRVYSQSSTVLSTHQQWHKERVYSQSSTVLSTHQQWHKGRVYSQSSTVCYQHTNSDIKKGFIVNHQLCYQHTNSDTKKGFLLIHFLSNLKQNHSIIIQLDGWYILHQNLTPTYIQTDAIHPLPGAYWQNCNTHSRTAINNSNVIIRVPPSCTYWQNCNTHSGTCWPCLPWNKQQQCYYQGPPFLVRTDRTVIHTVEPADLACLEINSSNVIIRVPPSWYIQIKL